MGNGSEVDIKKILYGILRSWRLILGVWCVAGAIFGGLRVVRKIEPVQEEQLVAYEKEKESRQQKIDGLSNSLAAEQAYFDHSVLMHIDSYNRGSASAQLYVKAMEPESEPEEGMLLEVESESGPIMKQAALVKAYGFLIAEDEILKQAAEEEEIQYTKELVSVEMDLDSDMILVTVIHQDEEKAKALLDGILNGVKARENWLNQMVGLHELVLLGEKTDLGADMALAEKQKEISNAIQALKDSLEEEKKGLEALKNPGRSSLSRKTLLLEGVKYGVLGGTVSAFFAAFLGCLHWMFCDKVESAEELEARFGLLELGSFGKKKKRAFQGMDHFLERLFGIEPLLEDDQVFRLIETRIQMYYPECARFYVAGGGTDGFGEMLAKRLEKGLPGRKVWAGGLVSREPMALKGMAACDGVILVVEQGKATYQGIRREALAVANCRSRVLGCVLI